MLGLTSIKTDAYPTTCYLMTFSETQCKGSCLFCPQGHFTNERERDRLSRITWPVYPLAEVMERLQTRVLEISFRDTRTGGIQKKKISPIRNQKIPKFSRICLQVVNYEGFFEDSLYIISQLKQIAPYTPISSAIPPITEEQMKKLRDAGLERICFSLDACTPNLFDEIKGGKAGGVYRWDEHIKALQNAIRLFGKGYVSTHFIVGMGEREREMINAIKQTITMGILPGLFMFTPIKGTPMQNFPRPPIIQFRHIQIARYLLLRDITSISRFEFDSHGTLKRIRNLDEAELRSIIDKQLAFLTAGCPGCNRPYYTAKPSEEQDGYPRPLTSTEKQLIFSELEHLIDRIE